MEINKLHLAIKKRRFHKKMRQIKNIVIILRVKYLLRIPLRTLAAASSLPNFPRQTASNLLADKVSI